MPPAAPTDLVAHAAFVRRLAWHLLRDDAAADDAAQETFARAFSHPPSEGPGLRAWLATVLRNVVRRRRRSTEREARRERAAARPEGTFATDSAVARSEILGRVVDAVSRLDADHREVVLLRHYQDLPPRVIAVRLDLPVETVKARLKRAHARLRASLDESEGGNVGGWRGALCTLVGPTWPVGSGLAVATTAGGIVMTTAGKIGIGVAAAAALAATTWVAVGPEEGSRPPEAVNGPVATAPETGRLQGVGLSARSPLASESKGTTPAAPVAVPAPWRNPEVPFPEVEAVNAGLTSKDAVEVVFLGGAPLDGVAVALEWPGRSSESPADASWPRHAKPYRDGVVRFDGLPTGAFVLRVVGPGRTERAWPMNVPQQPLGNHRQPVVLGTATLFGRVFDRSGSPARELKVSVRPDRSWHVLGAPASATSPTDGDGGYRIEGLPSGSYHVYVYFAPHDGAGDFRSENVTLATGEEKRLDLGLPTTEALWSGTARFESGARLRPPSVIVLEEKSGQPVLHVPVDAEGKFSQRVPRGTYRGGVWYRNRTGGDPGLSSFEVTIGDADVAQDLAFKGVRVSGVVRDAATRTPFTTEPGREAPWVRIAPADKTDDLGKATKVTVDPDGTFALDGIPPGRWRLTVLPPRGSKGTGSSVRADVESAHDVTGLVLEITRE